MCWCIDAKLGLVRLVKGLAVCVCVGGGGGGGNDAKCGLVRFV